jgi:Protein of unknown function (DUF3341)
MSRRIIVASFAQEEDLLGAVEVIRQRGCEIVDLYTPYPIHGLDPLLGWPRSRLPVVCFLCGAIGVVLALWFQFWTTAWDWPLNVGGRPWNSLPAFVPATFETMVLLAGFGLVFAWFCRSRLYPGKKARVFVRGTSVAGEGVVESAGAVTDDRFALVVHDPGPAAGPNGAVRQALQDCHAISLEERDEEEDL